ncbi:hypothetical protein VW29_17845 [Devosia limi DSM 17137]|uniref:Response regulatory domain-containing protein n=1 Tax=Devosia limi DSM 17137 TaxID=1121477 RepID=A0A0F5LAV5_9HYPH|nr:hypothetical protein VW29_17845 [Devosia limi DSM 17137]
MVDDDVLINMNTTDMVQDLGHAALEAYSGAQALTLLQSGARIDLLLTDYAMPGMTGVELAHAAQALIPGLPVLLATGYADLPDGVQCALPRLNKPYDQHQLKAQLEPLLSER